MELFDAALIAFQQDFQYISGGGKYILQKFIPFLLTFQYALFQQSFLIRKDFIKGTFGNAQWSGNIIHCNTLDTVRRKSFHRSVNYPLSQFRTGDKMLGIFAHFSFF